MKRRLQPYITLVLVFLVACTSTYQKTNTEIIQTPKTDTTNSLSPTAEFENLKAHDTKIDTISHYKFIGKFIKAEVFEGSGSYSFKNSIGKIKSFAFDSYDDQKIPFNFFDEEANTNEKFIGSWFEIEYSNKLEFRGELEEKIMVSKIIKITRKNRGVH